MACLHQLFRRDKSINVFPKGWGNCNKCVPDEKNKDCPGYVKVTLLVIEIKEGKGKVKKCFPPC